MRFQSTMYIFYLSFEIPLNFSFCTFTSQRVISWRKLHISHAALFTIGQPEEKPCGLFVQLPSGWLQRSVGRFPRQRSAGQWRNVKCRDGNNRVLNIAISIIWKSESECLKDWSPSKNHYSQVTMLEGNSFLVHFIQHISNLFKVWYWSAGLFI